MIFDLNVQLRHVFSVVSGATPDSGNQEYWDGDILWITPEDLGNKNSYYIADTRRKITPAGYKSSGVTVVPSHSIVLSKRAPIGHLALLQNPAGSNQGCFLLTSKCETDSRYFYYYLSSKVGYLQALGSGSTFTELGANDLKSIRIPYPPFHQQRVIADYLDRETGRLDALVAAKERMLGLLAEKRRALIATVVAEGVDSTGQSELALPDTFLKKPSRYRAKVDGNGDRSSAAGNDEVIAQSVSPFPTKRLKHIVSLRQSRVNGNEGGGSYIGLENIESWTGKIFDNLSATATEDSAPSNVFNPGDVLFGKLRPYLAKVWVAEFAGRSTTECIVMKPVEIESGFLGYACLNRNFIDAVDALTFGSKMPRADWNSIGNILIPIPPLPEQRTITDYLDRETARLDELAVRVRETIALLKERRGALISAAITGQIDVEGTS